MNRADILSPLFASIENLKSVGAQRQKLLEKLCDGKRILDLLAHAPKDHRKRLKLESISQIAEQKNLHKINVDDSNIIKENIAVEKDTQLKHIAIVLTIIEHIPPPRERLPYRIVCQDEDNTEIELLWFKLYNKNIKQQLPPEKKITVCGAITYYQGKPQITHPERILPESEFEKLNVSEPQWRLTQGITRALLVKALDAAVLFVPNLPEWLPDKLVEKYSYPNFRTALENLHKGEPPESNRARERLAYDELLAHQISLNIVTENLTKHKNIDRRHINHSQLQNYEQKVENIINEFHKQLLFEPTQAQKQAVDDVKKDLKGEYPMLRLLQGDVGSGKTYVAACAMLAAIVDGAQAVLMVPSEMLARQHEESFNKWLKPLGIKVTLLCASINKNSKEAAIKDIASGVAQIIIGTHALFQQDVIYKKLKLAVIDEQHKFGVYQRVALTEKAKSVDLLVMSATPIPRTLMLSVWGGINYSCLEEKPKGRKMITTKAISTKRINEVINAVERWRGLGEKIYWVCPHIKDSEVESNVVSIEERVEKLTTKFSYKVVASMHAQMSAQAREKALQQFVQGEADILVATTMIEVGIDIPKARAIVIENAEHFGLAQLHQLRGRVGRDEKQARCILLYDPQVNDVAKARLNILRQTQDGFKIAEEDWRLRGSGDTLGVRQSGLPQFLFADLSEHNHLAQITAQHAKKIIEQSTKLDINKREALRLLLELFQKNEALKTLSAA